MCGEVGSHKNVRGRVAGVSQRTRSATASSAEFHATATSALLDQEGRHIAALVEWRRFESLQKAPDFKVQCDD